MTLYSPQPGRMPTTTTRWAGQHLLELSYPHILNPDMFLFFTTFICLTNHTQWSLVHVGFRNRRMINKETSQFDWHQNSHSGRWIKTLEYHQNFKSRNKESKKRFHRGRNKVDRRNKTKSPWNYPSSDAIVTFRQSSKQHRHTDRVQMAAQRDLACGGIFLVRPCKTSTYHGFELKLGGKKRTRLSPLVSGQSRKLTFSSGGRDGGQWLTHINLPGSALRQQQEPNWVLQ